MQNGVSWDDFRKQAKMELEKAMMLNEELRQHVTIPPEQIQAYYDAHHDQFTVKQEKFQLAQILVAVPPNASPAEVAAAKAKADEVRKKAIAGEDFGELAKRYSDDDSKAQGGELGVFAPDDIMDEILAAIKNLRPDKFPKSFAPSTDSTSSRSSTSDMPGSKPLRGRERRHPQSSRSMSKPAGAWTVWVETDLVKQHDVETMY